MSGKAGGCWLRAVTPGCRLRLQRAQEALAAHGDSPEPGGDTSSTPSEDTACAASSRAGWKPQPCEAGCVLDTGKCSIPCLGCVFLQL